MGPRLCFHVPEFQRQLHLYQFLTQQESTQILVWGPLYPRLVSILSIFPSQRNFTGKLYISISLQGRGTASLTSYFNEQDCKVSPDKLKRSCDRSQASSRFIWGLTFNERRLEQLFSSCIHFGAQLTNSQTIYFSHPFRPVSTCFHIIEREQV